MALEFSQAIADEVCERIATGESLRKVCDSPHMPSASTICKWLGQNAEFQKQYAHAREIQADSFADEIVEISDDVTEDANSRRVRVDSRKWIAAKLRPKRYGDKLDVEHSGDVTVSVVNYGSPTST